MCKRVRIFCFYLSWFIEQYKSLSRDHLLSIIENLKINQRYSPTSHQTSSRKSSPESDLERIELLCESPHEEIQQLHLHFLDMISEVDHLKNTIARLQNNQEKTDNVLKKKKWVKVLVRATKKLNFFNFQKIVKKLILYFKWRDTRYTWRNDYEGIKCIIPLQHQHW